MQNIIVLIIILKKKYVKLDNVILEIHIDNSSNSKQHFYCTIFKLAFKQ
jgi:hypothetical protein